MVFVIVFCFYNALNKITPSLNKKISTTFGEALRLIVIHSIVQNYSQIRVAWGGGGGGEWEKFGYGIYKVAKRD